MSANFDPSHLIRMGIDPLRFLEEFIDSVYHVHGKDTEILAETCTNTATSNRPPSSNASPTAPKAGAIRFRGTVSSAGVKVCAFWPRAATAAVSPSNSKIPTSTAQRRRKGRASFTAHVFGRLLTG